MANVNEILMRQDKRSDGGTGSASKRKRSSKTSTEVSAEKKPRSSAISSWLSPAVKGRGIKSTITPTKVPKKVKSPSKAHPCKQSYIDVGQRSFGKHVSCSTCGLLYTVGEEEDEKEHQKFCKRVKRGVTISKWKTERTLKTFPDTCARILEIRRDDASSHVKKLLEVKAMLDNALGFVEEEIFLQRSHFVYIQGNHVVGCVNTERITEAFVLDKSASRMIQHDEESSIAAEGAVTASATSQSAVVGICQIWVHPSFRRRSIATRMVDIVREKSIYGMRVAKDAVAFAQPTRNGLLFAQKYMGSCEVLVY